MATSHSKRLSSLINLTRNPSTGSSCSDLYSMARARTAELLGVVVADDEVEELVAREPETAPEPAIIVAVEPCCDVEAAVAICSTSCRRSRALSMQNISEWIKTGLSAMSDMLFGVVLPACVCVRASRVNILLLLVNSR